MPAGSEWNRGRWESKSKLEKILIVLITVAVIIIVILSILLLKKPSTELSTEVCNTKACLIEASKIAQYVDSNINPCENFYEFACKKFLDNAHGDEKLNWIDILKERSKWELIEVYSDAIKDEDHKLVKTVKNLYRACMNIREIENDNLQTIKEDLQLLGGWPVVEATNWNGSIFNWLNATYKLRHLGYYYKVFLDLSLDHDPGNYTQFIYKLATPYMWDYSSYNFDKNKFMVDVAIRFGAPQYDRSVEESIKSAVNFLTQLQRESHARYTATVHRKYTVEQYQNLYGVIDWLEFINTLAGPGASISKSDFVLFPPPETLRNWINIIAKTSKRVQANYMIWKVIEETIPFLTPDLQNPALRSRSDETREDFCLQEIHARFDPSPAEIVCSRKYLPMEKKEQVEEMVENIKSQFIQSLENADWVEASNKQYIVEKTKAMKVIIGHPDDYFKDKILDTLDVDMIPVEDDSFLNLIKQANRNYQSMVYKQMKKPESFDNKLNIKPSYNAVDNVFFISTPITGDLLFNENRPKYLNYGTMGTTLGVAVTEILIRNWRLDYLNLPILTNQTKQEVTKRLKCFQDSVLQYGRITDNKSIIEILQSYMGAKLSHSAYQKWAKSNGKELPLIQTDFTPKQMFWISAVSTFCLPVPKYSTPGKMLNHQLVTDVVSASLRNHPDLAVDFNCPAGSKMNPSKRCEIF